MLQGMIIPPNIKRALLTIIRRFRTEKMFGNFSLLLFSAVGANVPVLSTWSSSMMASFPPPKMMISSLDGHGAVAVPRLGRRTRRVLDPLPF